MNQVIAILFSYAGVSTPNRFLGIVHVNISAFGLEWSQIFTLQHDWTFTDFGWQFFVLPPSTIYVVYRIWCVGYVFFAEFKGNGMEKSQWPVEWNEDSVGDHGGWMAGLLDHCILSWTSYCFR